MTTRKPKLNLLYVDEMAPRLQLVVVTPDQKTSSLEHARRWQSVRFNPTQPAAETIPAAYSLRKH